MDITKSLIILEALASGCSPITGELIQDDSILNERDVIRALQFAIDHLKQSNLDSQSKIDIDEHDIQTIKELFLQQGRKATPNSLAGFFLGIRKFKNRPIVEHKLYGKYQNMYAKGQLIDYFNQYNLNTKSINLNSPDDSYKEIDFFRKAKFNMLSENSINQLKEKINELGVLKTDGLSDSIVSARKIYPRAYEHWSEKELALLRKAIKYTNDLNLLSDCFQRGRGSIEIYGQKLIYNAQNEKEKTE